MRQEHPRQFTAGLSRHQATEMIRIRVPNVPHNPETLILWMLGSYLVIETTESLSARPILPLPYHYLGLRGHLQKPRR